MKPQTPYKPRNAATGKAYRKRTRNALSEALDGLTLQNGMQPSPWWATYTGWTLTGARVKRGQRGTVIQPEGGRSFVLFHLSQLAKRPDAKRWDKAINDAHCPEAKARKRAERAEMREANARLRAMATLAPAPVVEMSEEERRENDNFIFGEVG